MKSIVKAIIAGGIFIVIGVIIVVSVLAANGWKLKGPDYTMVAYTEAGSNGTLNLEISAGSMKTEYYDGDKIIIEYPTFKGYRTKISESDGVLKMDTDLKWYASVFTWWDLPETVIKLPQSSVYNLKLEVSAGNVNIADGTFGSVKLEVSAGNVTLNGGECEKLDCDISAGNLKIANLTCPDIKADVSAGKISLNLNEVKAEFTIITDISAGSCNVSNQRGTTDKIIRIDCSAGSVNVSFNN